MPMLCPVCGYVEHSKEESCAKCGSSMRYSLLAGLSFEGDGKTIRIGAEGMPTWSDRCNQVVAALIWFSFLAVGLAFLALVLAATSQLPPATLAAEHSRLFQTIAACVVILATAISVQGRLKGVYLAQLVGSLVGLLGAAGVSAARLYVGIPFAWYEWFVVPVCGAVGFLVGLRVGGKLEPSDAIELKPIDAWDRTAKPTERELPPPLRRRWNRLGAGVVVGMILVYTLPSVVAFLVAPFLRNASLLAVAMGRADMLLFGLALFGAGMLAGSGTRHGLLQGLLCGFLVFGMVHLLTPYKSYDEVQVKSIAAVVLAAIGGMVGRRIFRPDRIYGNAKTADPVGKVAATATG